MLLGSVMGADGVERIREATFGILENTGLRLEHDKVRDLLISKGAVKGRDNETVRFPREMVGEYLQLAPAGVIFAGRSAKADRVAAGSPSIFWTAAALNVAEGSERREFEKRDLERLTRLVDSLENISGIVGVSVKDVPPHCRDFAGYRVMAANTGKHVRVLSFSPRGVEAILEMAGVFLDGETIRDKPIFSMGFTAHGPLRWTRLALDIYYTSAGHGIPVMVNGEPMAGATSPVTLAGALTVGNAEIIGGIVLNQVLEPGRPCIHNLGFAHVLDMRTGVAVTGAPENCLLAAAGAELARSYGLPSASWMSSDAMLADSQSAIEKTMAALTHAAAGVGLIWGAGTLESELCISLAQLVLDDEIIAQVRRLLKGVKVDRETIARELIEEIGPCGNFLATEHTMAHFREEIYETSLFCRMQREKWEDQGSRPLQELAAGRAEELISRAAPPALTAEQVKELDRIEKKFLQDS
ncbi:MAG: trimethylamine methyltransferase family protein [Candidatus Glassbacteria bacterium]